ncbi:cytochrome c oxidase subunit 3 (mitochondrion) [Fonticula alba]|uniref:Cytochrome c oxidase subunit 3 n=1 Tax=Fonticula alba TaxID=691883 RepID=A0A058YZQ7_FONAL|nr:cytochrome c oxidase subunit 3 [Fonticula alba]KCV67188.1 cytochrome c oxidase subunit 3 [Fonticula alba]|eukprot:XP_009498411.1 cytochrome c oxidase subunit 3 (mitochondrion) [Fonticula alba]
MRYKNHTYHILDNSPWPIFMAFSLMLSMKSAVLFMHGFNGGSSTLLIGFLLVLLTFFCWFVDVSKESTLSGCHTYLVQRGLKIGFILFIVSELMFFVALFWAFFHSSLAPSVDLGVVWPPKGIQALNPLSVPLLNTIVLVASGVVLTWGHHAIITANKPHTTVSLLITIILAMSFTGLQFLEYIDSTFSIADSVYGSTFFMCTGFHGIHIIIGTIYLITCLYRTVYGLNTNSSHVGFDTCAWYYHFVDIVWIFMFISVYYWPYSPTLN